MDHAKGPEIQSQHLTGNVGELLVRVVFMRAGASAIAVSKEDDYGSDLLIQVPHRNTNRVSGSLIRVQVKCGGSKYHSADGTGRCYLSEAHRAYYSDGLTPAILVTVNPADNTMHWGNITEQLRRNRHIKSVSALEPFNELAVQRILQLARVARPGDWVLALASNEPISRRIAIEGCLLTAHQDRRTLDSIRAHAPRMSFDDLAFLAYRIKEEGFIFMGQTSLIDFQHEFNSDLEALLPMERSFWKREPYGKDVMQHLTELFVFSMNELMEMVERNRNLLSDRGLIERAAGLLDMQPGEHAAALFLAVVDDIKHAILSNSDFREEFTLPMFAKALELDPEYVQHQCENAGIRVMDVIAAVLQMDPELAAAMWASWHQ